MKQPLLIFYLFALMVVCTATSARAQESTSDKIVLSDLTWDDDAEAYVFTVSLDGSRIYTAYNMDIFLPQGVNVKYDEDGDEKSYWVSLSEDKDFYPYTKVGKTVNFKHNVSSSLLPGNQLRVSCIAQDNSEFKLTDGELFMVYVSLDDNFYGSAFSPKPIITVSGIALVQKENSKKYVPADFSCRPFTTGVTAERTLPINISSTNKAGTLILPFDADLPDGVKAYGCSAVEDNGDETGTLTLTDEPSFEACKPYLVYAENGYSGTISGTVNLTADYPENDVYSVGCLTGVLSSTVVNMGYIMQNQGEGPMFYNADGASFILPAGRCYLTLPASEIKALNFDFENAKETTKITSLSKKEGDLEEDIWYTLQGVKLEQKPTEKGVYLLGNKKVIIQ